MSNPAIEPGVRPVCDVLNAMPDVRTVYSCEGHPRAFVPSKPFVMFKAPAELAFGIHCMLAYGHGDGSLNFCWRLLAQFDDDSSMTYTLTTSDVRVSEKRWRPFQEWTTKAMNLDLLQLASLLRNRLSGEIDKSKGAY